MDAVVVVVVVVVPLPLGGGFCFHYHLSVCLLAGNSKCYSPNVMKFHQ